MSDENEKVLKAFVRRIDTPRPEAIQAYVRTSPSEARSARQLTDAEWDLISNVLRDAEAPVRLTIDYKDGHWIVVIAGEPGREAVTELMGEGPSFSAAWGNLKAAWASEV